MDGMSDKLNQYLTTSLLIAAAFVIGMLFTEVRYLKKGNTSAAVPAPVAAAAAPDAQPSPISALTADQLEQLVPVNDTDHIRGNQNAKITLIEYSDFECPFCQSFRTTLDQIVEDYGDQVRLVFRHYPLSFHPYAQKAAEAAECVAKFAGNEAFWKFHDLYFDKTLANGTGYPQDKLVELAQEAGVVNTGDFQVCLDSGEMAQKVTDQQTNGAEVGIQGTPGTILLAGDGKKGSLIGGALGLEAVKAEIEKYR